MTTSAPKPGERVADVRFDDDTMSVDLADGRTITVPLTWYPRLLNATPEQRRKWERCGGGFGIHWPEIDEDLSTRGLLEGIAAPRRPAEARGERVDSEGVAEPALRQCPGIEAGANQCLIRIATRSLWASPGTAGRSGGSG
ncbi:MAG: DUF2442 domain-containing protein [Phycisphaerales bacterium]|nr:DUF2442 domain-containing protein [Phycisphaerales bacterium]